MSSLLPGGASSRALAYALAAAAVLCAPAAAQDAPAPEQEKQAVLAVVNKLFDAMRARDTASIRSLFDPSARLVRVTRRQDGTETVDPLPAADFAAMIGRSQRGPLIERIWDPDVRVDGNLASVWTEYDLHIGTEFSHCGVDAFHLLKIAGTWKIVALADTARREGCVKRAPPQ